MTDTVAAFVKSSELTTQIVDIGLTDPFGPPHNLVSSNPSGSESKEVIQLVADVWLLW